METLGTIGVADIAVVAPPPAMAAVAACLERDPAKALRPQFIPLADNADLPAALQAAAEFVGEGAAVLHSPDGLLGDGADDVARLLAGSGPDLTLLLHRSPTPCDGLGQATERLLRIAELDGSPKRLALAGVSLFGPGALRRCAAAAAGAASDDLVAAAEAFADAGGRLEAAIVRDWHQYGGDPLDLLELNRVVLDRQTTRCEPRDHGNNRIEGRVIIDPSAEVTDSIILGPCIIGPGARVTDSYVGPYTSIGANAEIEGAEIVRSIVAEGVRILHVGGRIEGSTIGRRANIFRDFGLPRAMRLHVGEDVQVALN
jgi:glucose-1-phosphate thymidylyltransferase